MRIPTPISGIDYRQVAEKLFNVRTEEVTPAMLARCKTVTFALRYAQPMVAVRVKEGSATEAQTTVMEHWPDCPTCKQSATGRYFNGIHGCTRCGWSAGGAKTKRGVYD